MNVQDLLDHAKSKAGIPSDYALSQRLGVTKQAVSKWRLSQSAPDPVTCEKLAVLSGFPLHQVIGVVGEARAISTAEKRVWRKLAAAIFVSLCVTLPVQASADFPTNGSDRTIHYAKYAQRLRKAWHALRKALATLNYRPGDLDEASPVLA